MNASRLKVQQFAQCHVNAAHNAYFGHIDTLIKLFMLSWLFKHCLMSTDYLRGDTTLQNPTPFFKNSWSILMKLADLMYTCVPISSMQSSF